MPNGTKSYKVGSDVYDIPNEKSASFLKAYPNAQEVQSYAVDKDTFDIPAPKVNDFLKAYPQAKPVGYDSKEVQQNQQKTYTYHPELGHPIENNQQALDSTLQDYSATHQQSKNASMGYDNAFVPKGKSGSDIITANEKAADEKLTKAAENTYNKTIGRGSHTKADSANYVNQLKQGVKNGDLGITQDAAGNDVIKNSGNFFQSFKAAADQAYAQDIENKYLRSIPKDEAISYLNRIQQKPETGIVKESDIAPNGLGELAGSQSQLIGKTTMGGMAGAETGLTGGASVGGFLAIAKDLANSGYAQAIKKNYYLLKQQGLSDSEAFDKATQAGLVGEATSLGTGVLLSGEINLMPKNATVQGVENSLKHTIKATPKVVGSAGVGSVINDITTNAEANGNPIDKKQMLSNAEEAMKPMLLIHGALGALGAIANGQKTIVPSYARPQLENMAASADRNSVSTYLNQQEQKGEIPQGTTQKVLQKLNEFDAQKRVVENLPIPEENKAAITGKLIQKQDLLDEKASLKPNENALPKRIANIDKEISGIDGEINKFYDAKDVFQKEKDALTGEGGTQPKQFDELKKQEQDGIVVPKEYGATDVTEKGEGDTKTFTPKAFYIEKQGALEIKKNIPIDENGFTDKDKAQAAADNALKQHYYENGLHDNAKPDKKITEEKNQTLVSGKNNEASDSEDGRIAPSESGTNKENVGETLQPQQTEENGITVIQPKENPIEIESPLSTEQNIDSGTQTENPISETDNTNPPESPKEEPPLSEGADETTSIKNATTRLRREQHGLDDEIPAAKKEFGDTWDEAKDKIENGYNPQDLIDELAKKPRPVTDVENAILLHAQNTKEINLIDLNIKINEAAEKNDTQALQEAKIAKARVLDELQKLYDVNKAVGTENARGLASRQMMVDRRYSLANMVAEKRATANDGKPLSEEQQAQVEELYKKINETQKAFDDYVKEAELEIKGLQEKILGKKITNKKSAAQKLRDFADKIEKNASGQTYATVIPITPKMIAGAMRLIADGLEKGEDVLNLIKDAIEKIKGENSDIDEAKLRKAINSEVINSNIISTTEKAAKKNKDYSGLLLNNKLDHKALELNAASERAKNEFDISLKKDEASKKSLFQKSQNVFVKWERGFKLSNPLTMGKLVMAGATRLTTTPLEDIVGAAYSQVLPQLAKGAIGEGGGLNVSETAKAYKDGLLEGMKDAATIMKKGSQGKSDIDVSFGKLGELPPEAIDFFGQLHSATKAPIKRIAFERSLSKRLRRNIANGVDVSDPLVQTEILTGAYKDANRAIFMQDNKVATGFQNLVKYFEQEDKQTGKSVNKPLATALQWMLPFVKIPTNIAAETGAHVYGLPLEIGKGIVRMFDKNESKLTADEKDIIFRNLKKGTLGVAALALGYLNPQNFGGYYQKGQKRQDDDAQALGLKIFGHRIPAWFVEAPIFQAMQLGATIRRVKDDKVKGVEKGISEGVWAGALGLVDRVPMVDQPMRMAEIFGNQKDREYYVDELAKSTVDPALITYFANVTDPADTKSIAGKILNPENKRSPQTMIEHIKSGLPYFREQVGEKPQSFNEKDKKDPTFKYFLDKGLQLPNTSLSSEEVPNTGNHISDYPKDIQDKYIAEHKVQLKNELQSIRNKNYVYVSSVKNLKGEIVNDVATHKQSSSYKKTPLDNLSTEELAQVLHIAQSQATEKAKKKIFKK